MSARPDYRPALAKIEALAKQQEPQTTEIVITPNLAEICAKLPGSYRLVPTHFEPLDANMRGGLKSGRLLVVGGYPGALKSGFALFNAMNMSTRGVVVNGVHRNIHVDFCAHDEPREGMLSRAGQMYGLKRDDLENEDLSISGPAWNYVAGFMRDEYPRLTIWDRHEGTVEAVVRRRRAQGIPEGDRYVVFVDSLQEGFFDCDVDMRDKSRREQIDARMRSMRGIATEHRITFVINSELVRPSPGARPNLHSFKESSGIEYGVDVGLILERVKSDTADIVDATIVKNRLGQTDVTFRMERTSACRFIPGKMPDEEDIEEARAAADEKRVEELAEEIVQAVLRAKVRPTRRDELADMVSGPNALKVKAITALKISGRLRGGKGQPFEVVS